MYQVCLQDPLVRVSLPYHLRDTVEDCFTPPSYSHSQLVRGEKLCCLPRQR